MSKTLDTTWFNPGRTQNVIGLSAIKKDDGEVVFRLGIGHGFNHDDDEREILDWGAKFNLEQVLQFIKDNQSK